MTQHSPIEGLLAQLFSRDVRVWIDGDRLRCSGPEREMTPELTQTLKARKPDILAFLRANMRSRAVPIHARSAPTPPLSFPQQGLWLAEQMWPGTALYSIPLALEACGTLDLAAFRSALGEVFARHAVLRSRIVNSNGEARQEILDGVRLPLLHLDRSANPPDNDELAILVRDEARRPFDLASDLPLRATVITLGVDRSLIMLTLHHIVADGWSIDLLFQDLSAAYNRALSRQGEPPVSLPIQYGDFAAWQRENLNGETLDRLLAFWKGHLQPPPPVTQLPSDFQRPPVRCNSGGLVDIEIEADIVTALRGLAAAEGATLFAALFTVFAILVHRYTGQTDMVIGTPVANRDHGETEHLIGLFVNPLPIRLTLDPTKGFAGNLRWTQAALRAVLDHQDLPFERLVEELKPDRDLSISPLFQLKFQLDPERRAQAEFTGLRMRRLPRQDGIAKHDLSLDLRETGEGVRGSLEYDMALFRKDTVRRLGRHYVNLVRATAADPARRITDLALLSDDEQRQQITAWNDTDTAYHSEACFQAIFETRAAEMPDAVALVQVTEAGVTRWTYDALNRRANELAHALRRRNVGPETVVGIAIERSPAMIVAWLAVLKAGAAYLPLDPAYPPDRLAYMLADSGARLVLAHSTTPLALGLPRIDLDTDWPDDVPDTNPPCVTRPDHLAYVIYTSGSTGRPKGVLVEHGGLVNLTEDKIRTCGVNPGDCVLQFFSFSFDASIPELVMSLGAGARLLLLPTTVNLPGPELARALSDHGVTHITMTPSALMSLPGGDYPELRVVLTGGEAPSPELIERWTRSRLFLNAYGPTETTVNASMVACGNGRPIEPTLRPAANKQLHVLGGAMEVLPIGVPGELYIGGIGLARGYQGRPDLTAERFLPDPFAPPGAARVLYRTGDRACRLADGRIRILGRLDDQVKIRGYRIEPAEVEAAVLAHPDVAGAAVIPWGTQTAEKRLVAYGVPSTRQPLPAAEMRRWLAGRLPRFLVPDAFVWLDYLPLTVNGKIDIRTLPAPDFTSAGRGRPPRGETERAIAAAFETVLSLSEVSAMDDFFELGGHSLLATRLVAVARERFGIEIGVLDVFNAPTICELAARVKGPVSTDDLEPWHADVVLASDIRPAARVERRHPPRRVLLTGATGFLGAYLLHELLRDPDREVWCLMRNGGLPRLEEALRHYGLWEDGMTWRLHAVAGDLASPGLGLAPQVHTYLAAHMDAIVHNGAEVHHLLPYARLRTTNVEGTREMIRLACAGPGRPLHHISTLSALVPRREGETIFETEEAAAFVPPQGGYNLSKWVAEQLVAEAGRRGLPITIHRAGSISGDSRNGAFNSADTLCRIIQGYLRSGAAPEGDARMRMLPVDYVAHAIVHLADSPAFMGRTSHLLHSHSASSDLLFEACALEGRPLQRLTRAEWDERLDTIARSEPDHPLYPLMGLLEARRKASSPSGGATYDCRSTRAALEGAPCAEPVLDISLFRTYVRALAKAGASAVSVVGERANG